MTGVATLVAPSCLRRYLLCVPGSGRRGRHVVNQQGCSGLNAEQRCGTQQRLHLIQPPNDLRKTLRWRRVLAKKAPHFHLCIMVLLVCVCDTHSLVEMALACVGLRPGVCWAMAGRDESSLSEVRVRKVSVFMPTTSEPSCSSWPGAVSCGRGEESMGTGWRERPPKTSHYG